MVDNESDNHLDCPSLDGHHMDSMDCRKEDTVAAAVVVDDIFHYYYQHYQHYQHAEAENLCS